MPAREISSGVASFFNKSIGSPKDKQVEARRHARTGRSAGKIRKPGSPRESIDAGIIMPFQPSINGRHRIEEQFISSIKELEVKLALNYPGKEMTAITGRGCKLFSRLNFNTHRKSIAVILKPGEEKVFYLDYTVKPQVFTSRNISVLDLAEHIHLEPGFFYVVIDMEEAMIYDVDETRIWKLYKARIQPRASSLPAVIMNVLANFNSGIGKPVFVAGRTELVKSFCKNYTGDIHPCLKHMNTGPFSEISIRTALMEIVSNWDYWRLKTIRGKIISACNTSQLLKHAPPVFQGLEKGLNGILIMDRRFKRLLQKPDAGKGNLNLSAGLDVLFENFLSRGNQVMITDAGWMNPFGGIALLKQPKIDYGVFRPYTRLGDTGARIL